MNVPPEPVFISEKPGSGIDFIHSIISIPDYGGTQEKAGYPSLSQIFHEHARNLFRLERTATDIRFRAERAVLAVVGACIGKKGFQKDGIPALRQNNRVKPFAFRSSPAVLILAGAARAGQIIL
jgi:hypothetical protein